MTASALMQKPYNDFFKVGVSTSGNHDNNIYNSAWSETYHGLKEVPVPADPKKEATPPARTGQADRVAQAGDPIEGFLDDEEKPPRHGRNSTRIFSSPTTTRRPRTRRKPPKTRRPQKRKKRLTRRKPQKRKKAADEKKVAEDKKPRTRRRPQRRKKRPRSRRPRRRRKIPGRNSRSGCRRTRNWPRT